ncbi:MAG: nicotinate-nucleotide--dimethylbenzimidazole phosphoribosyltransferase, partial [Planctomycetes bacterium]|nr:nicotinate-nucleotide--dimethylbenzimidazole phosphoribosyltransferase [Planctomycetota bacterium]
LNGARVVVADLGMRERDDQLVSEGLLLDRNVGRGTANFRRTAAMSRDQARQAVAAGIGLARELAATTDVFGTGEMGIGNTSPATAIAACMTGRPVASLCGAGAGLDRDGVDHKAQVIHAALDFHRPDPADALDILAKVGGFEIAGIAGLVLGAAAERKPVLVDGFISSAGAMLACLLCPAVRPYLFLSHASAEPGHAAICEWLGDRPLLDLAMRLGEGTGAAMAMNILAAATAILTDMATFSAAGISLEGNSA